jgi:two-component system, cell cycle sensor histidine kinase and response regulator CckA
MTSQAPATILLVDDEDPVRRLLRILLENDGYSLLEAPTGAKALHLAEHHDGRIDVLITDVRLPGMNGCELAHLLTQARPRLRVIYISGHAMEALSELGLVEPGQVLLQKPFKADDLRGKVREALAAGDLPPR